MTLPPHVGVCGGGRMGAGIAHAFLLAGAGVTLVETSSETRDAALDRVTRSLGEAADRGLVEDRVEVLDRLEVTTDPAALAAAGLVVEAVPEDADLKVEVLRRVSDVAPDALLATNTSSLSVSTIADGLPAPERLIGLHFFNPVPASELVEIVVGRRTPTDLVELAEDWVADLGRTGIVVADCPGFASSRLGVALALEAMRMVEEGVAGIEDVDTAMTLGYRHPVGPLRTSDLVGLDVRLAVAEHLARTLGPRFAPPSILRDLVRAGDLGRKTGQGFYTW